MTPTFLPILEAWPRERVLERLHAASADDVRRCLNKGQLHIEDMLRLLSPAAAALLEDIAQRAHCEHLRHFGRAVTFFTPLYISDHCANQCRYCGF
ncbi:MAG: 2-iminoacetate synthase ThiH, partial [Desulfovibrionaceae bacterium]|nr:2-iminoacetate synthase ThiH [Desulfovibrionaceae bacterium]